MILFNGLLLNCAFGEYALGNLAFGKLLHLLLFNCLCSIDHVKSSLIRSTDLLHGWRHRFNISYQGAQGTSYKYMVISQNQHHLSYHIPVP